jgi:hypothetical protein
VAAQDGGGAYAIGGTGKRILDRERLKQGTAAQRAFLSKDEKPTLRAESGQLVSDGIAPFVSFSHMHAVPQFVKEVQRENACCGPFQNGTRCARHPRRTDMVGQMIAYSRTANEAA